jgi:MATE family multidrug resistance protein
MRLAVPVVVVQLGLRMMGVVDTIMVGHVPGDEALASVALGTVSTFACLIFGMGVLHALDPLVAQAAGSGDDEGIARALQRGLLLCVLLTIPIAGVLFAAEPLLRALGQPERVIPEAALYMRINTIGVAPFLCSSCCGRRSRRCT